MEVAAPKVNKYYSFLNNDFFSDEMKSEIVTIYKLLDINHEEIYNVVRYTVCYHGFKVANCCDGSL